MNSCSPEEYSQINKFPRYKILFPTELSKHCQFHTYSPSSAQYMLARSCTSFVEVQLFVLLVGSAYLQLGYILTQPSSQAFFPGGMLRKEPEMDGTCFVCIISKQGGISAFCRDELVTSAAQGLQGTSVHISSSSLSDSSSSLIQIFYLSTAHFHCFKI